MVTLDGPSEVIQCCCAINQAEAEAEAEAEAS